MWWCGWRVQITFVDLSSDHDLAVTILAQFFVLLIWTGLHLSWVLKLSNSPMQFGCPSAPLYSKFGIGQFTMVLLFWVLRRTGTRSWKSLCWPQNSWEREHAVTSTSRITRCTQKDTISTAKAPKIALSCDSRCPKTDKRLVFRWSPTMLYRQTTSLTLESSWIRTSQCCCHQCGLSGKFCGCENFCSHKWNRFLQTKVRRPFRRFSQAPILSSYCSFGSQL